MEDSLTYEQLLAYNAPSTKESLDKMKLIQFQFEEALRDILRKVEPRSENSVEVPYYERIGFLVEYKRRNP